MKKIRLASWFLALSTLLWQMAGILPVQAGPAPFYITAPNGGENWTVGSTQDISWVNNYSNYYTHIDIYYSTAGNDPDGSWEWIDSTSPNSSPYSWVIPNTPTTTAAVKIVAYRIEFPADEYFSEDVFTISQPAPTQILTVVRPNGGEFWRIGTLQPIRWTSTNIYRYERIRIELFRNNQWRTIGWAPNIGFFFWRVTGPRTDKALIRISLVSDPTINDTSDAYFRINYR